MITRVALAVTLALTTMIGWLNAAPAEAVIVQMYTLPFQGQYAKTCGFGCYSGHEGTDYKLGDPSAGGHPVVAAARGTAWLFFDPGQGPVTTSR